MLSALNFVKDFIISIFIMFSMVFTPIHTTPYIAKDPDTVKLVFNVVSDVHVETNNTESYTNFKKVLRGLKDNKSSSANVFLGDNTMNGQSTENFLLFGGLSAMFDDENIFLALGNHDVGNGEGDYDELLNRYLSYHNFFLKNDIDKPYYYRVINGCYMIFLATEELCVHSFSMSDEQMTWLRDTLDEASESGNPVFVFSHHPLDYIENDDEYILYDILNDYKNTYHIHGHTHWDYYMYEEEGVICTNLSRVTDDGIGVTIEVYDDEVLFRERDFINGVWLSETSVPIVK